MPKSRGRAYRGSTFGRRIMTPYERRAASAKNHELRIVDNLKKAFRRRTKDQIADIATLLFKSGKKAKAIFRVGLPTEEYEIVAMEIAPQWFQKHNIVLSQQSVLYLKKHPLRARRFPRCCLNEADAASLRDGQKLLRIAKSDVQHGHNRVIRKLSTSSLAKPRQRIFRLKSFSLPGRAK